MEINLLQNEVNGFVEEILKLHRCKNVNKVSVNLGYLSSEKEV